MRGTNGVEITRKVKVDVFHGNHLGVTSTSSPAFHAKTRAEAWLA